MQTTMLTSLIGRINVLANTSKYKNLFGSHFTNITKHIHLLSNACSKLKR